MMAPSSLPGSQPLRHALWVSLLAAGGLLACRGPEHGPEATQARASAHPVGMAPSAKSGASADGLPAAAASSGNAGVAPSGGPSASSAVPASELAAASPSTAGSAAPGCPAGMAGIGKYCIDRWEAHLVVRVEGEDKPHPHHQRPEKGVTYEARSTSGVFPQAYVNRGEAEAACQSAGKRLCSLKEWYQACRGSKGLLFPYGKERVPKKCNSSKPHLLSRMFGNDPKEWTYDKAFNSPRLNQQAGFLSRTGEYEGCVSDYGVYDMVGNVHEWVSDKVDGSLPQKVALKRSLNKKLHRNRGHGIFMGGFFSTTAEHGPGCTFTTIGHEGRYHDYSTGFRCCRDRDAK